MLWQVGPPRVFKRRTRVADGSVPVFYIDGHRKAVYADHLIPRGLVGRLEKVLGCRALVVLHDQEGHPLLVLKPVYTRAGVELTSPQEGCKLADKSS